MAKNALIGCGLGTHRFQRAVSTKDVLIGLNACEFALFALFVYRLNRTPLIPSAFQVFQWTPLNVCTLEAMRTQAASKKKTMSKFFKKRLVVSKEESRGGWYSRGYFPHFDGEGVTQHVCFHLFDSLPQHVLDKWSEELESLPERQSDIEKRTRIQDFLDSGYGECFLRDDRLAEIVENALLHFDGERYALHAWCVMPNHVHALFMPETGFNMSKIAHSWKSFTANECNKVLGRIGKFWERDPFDRYIRNDQHYRNAIAYIENNPVKARLCEKPEDWRWSSARRRVTLRE